jgi:hypothetical protein
MNRNRSQWRGNSTDDGTERGVGLGSVRGVRGVWGLFLKSQKVKSALAYQNQ